MKKLISIVMIAAMLLSLNVQVLARGNSATEQ